jgi:hypothetical protein
MVEIRKRQVGALHSLLMKEGAKWELYIPSELAYGDRGAGGAIPGNVCLVFTLELYKDKGDYVK